MKEYPCKTWAKYFYILDPTIINDYVHEQPFKLLVAVECFLHKKKRTLLNIYGKERADEIIQLLYSIVKQVFESKVTLEERTIDVLLNVCAQTQKQFYKIKEALEMEDLEELKKKRAREYAEDGYTYLETCKTKYRRTSLLAPLDLPEEVIYAIELRRSEFVKSLKNKNIA